MIQETRRFILDILRKRGQATVDEIVSDLQKRRGNITPVTVRHHLGILQQDGLITSPELKRRHTPGRPQHIYTLTEKGHELFPSNFQHLAAGLIEEIKRHLPPEGVNVILEGVATRMAAEAAIPDLPLPDRLNMVVQYLTQHGYEAAWERTSDGYLLHTSNCPYHHLVESGHSLCEMDMRLVSALLGIVPRRVSHLASGDEACSYHIPDVSFPLNAN